MQKNYKLNAYLNQIFRNIKLKKQYKENLKNKVILLKNVKEINYKILNSKLSFKSQSFYREEFLVNYVIDITFFRSNTLLHVMDFSGNLKLFCSAGSLQYKGKSKKFRRLILKRFYRILVSKLKFLKSKPIALHLKNVGYSKFKIIKELKKKFFIKIIRSFNLYPHNGCRKRKIKRKKIRTKKFRPQRFRKRRNG